MPSVEVTRRRMRINDVKNIQKERPLYIETHLVFIIVAALIPWLSLNAWWNWIAKAYLLEIILFLSPI